MAEAKGEPDRWNRIFWIRVLLAIISGILAGIFKFTLPHNPNAYLGIFIAVIFYLASISYVKLTMRNIPKEERYKVITTGMGSFILIFLFIWMLYNSFEIAFS
ncbi:MAG: hypothetical protein RMJ31_01545 [Nitrososphaerota archaeon]|nr:hypothetical protein [Nitrososphaerales archaeon]MCX8191285.1 hypothetical protein [Nitrososphaerales archaeon]MDW8044444.1 hypothetical protein [Nitrososphaerota archaeon]